MNTHITISVSWTPEQAMTLIDFLNDIIRAVWDEYESGLIDLCFEKASIQAHQEAELLFPDPADDIYHEDDDIPF